MTKRRAKPKSMSDYENAETPDPEQLLRVIYDHAVGGWAIGAPGTVISVIRRADMSREQLRKAYHYMKAGAEIQRSIFSGKIVIEYERCANGIEGLLT